MIIITVLLVLWWLVWYYLNQSWKLKTWCPEWFKEECNSYRCTCNKQPCEYEDYVCTDWTSSWYINRLCFCDHFGMGSRRWTGLKQN